jgi:hypothetical protein
MNRVRASLRGFALAAALLCVIAFAGAADRGAGDKPAISRFSKQSDATCRFPKR